MKASVLVGAAVLCVVSLSCRKAAPLPLAAVGTTASPFSRGDQLVLAAVRVGLPPAGEAPAGLPDGTSQGAMLLTKYCAQCHALPDPRAHSATDWPSVARRMWLRMDYLPDSFDVLRPTAEERYEILSYLTAHGLQVSDATLPAAPGRASFEVVCSRCHALADPRVHSPNDWDIVYARMVQNMERMGVALPTPDQGNEILMYLKAVSGKPGAKAAAPRSE